MRGLGIRAFCCSLGILMFFTCGQLGIQSAFAEETDELRLVPLGNAVGVTLNMDGVMVVNVAEMLDEQEEASSPAKDAGIKPGDLIRKIDGKEIRSVEQMSEVLSETGGQPIKIEVERRGKTEVSLITPAKDKVSGDYKLAAWVKDAASGIGTLTFYDPDTGYFGALGHSITDNETGDAVSLAGGDILKSTIVTVDRGEKGKPGELKGVFVEEKDALGSVMQNNETGVFGKMNENFRLENSTALPTAKLSDVKVGPAYILSNVEGSQVQKFNVEIQRIDTGAGASCKDFVLKVTDPALLEKTGGIVQGM